MSTDTNPSEDQLSNIIQLWGFLREICKFARLLMKVTATLAKNLSTLLATMASASAIDGAI